MAPPSSPPPGSPLLWMLLINGLFWGGLFGGEALVHRLELARQARPRATPPLPAGTAVLDLLEPDPLRQAGPPLPARAATSASLLAAWGAPLAAGMAPDLPAIGPDSGPDSASDQAPALAPAALAPAALVPAGLAPDPVPTLAQQLSGADALGGEITLANLGEPRMLPAARAEQQRWRRSGNPLAALPLHWQQRFNQEIAGGAPIQRAQVVRVPVRQLTEPEEVAVLIDDGGSAQALNLPRQPQVREAVEAWASRQQPAQEGQLQAVVIAAEPLPQPVAIVPPVVSEPAPPAAPEPAGPEPAAPQPAAPEPEL
jgi:hypothetical protein